MADRKRMGKRVGYMLVATNNDDAWVCDWDGEIYPTIQEAITQQESANRDVEGREQSGGLLPSHYRIAELSLVEGLS